jgi:hypothetical protein
MSRFRACWTTHAWTGVLGGSEDAYPAGAVPNNGKDADLRSVEQVSGKEVQRQDPVRLGPQELGPARSLPAGRGIDAGVLEDLPDRGRRHGEAESGQFAVDAAVTPRLVLPGKPQHHRPDLSVRCRAPGPALARPAQPPAADDVPAPPQDGARSDDQPHRGETVDRQRPSQQGKQRPVRPRQPGTSPRPLTPGDSKLVAQHEDLGVLPPGLATRQAQQRHGTGNDQEDQLQAHKPKIIPPPVGPRPARRMPNARPRSIGPLPRWHGFSATLRPGKMTRGRPWRGARCRSLGFCCR